MSWYLQGMPRGRAGPCENDGPRRCGARRCEVKHQGSASDSQPAQRCNSVLMHVGTTPSQYEDCLVVATLTVSILAHIKQANLPSYSFCLQCLTLPAPVECPISQVPPARCHLQTSSGQRRRRSKGYQDWVHLVVFAQHSKSHSMCMQGSKPLSSRDQDIFRRSEDVCWRGQVL